MNYLNGPGSKNYSKYISVRGNMKKIKGHNSADRKGFDDRIPASAPSGNEAEFRGKITKEVYHKQSPGSFSPADKVQTRINAQMYNEFGNGDLTARRQEGSSVEITDESERVSARVPSSSIRRPGSRPGSVRERPSSSFLRPKGSAKSPSFKDRHGLKYPRDSSGDDDEEDITTEDLSELLGTVRQYAQEIREIYAPMQKDKEERVKKRNEGNLGRQSKEVNKFLTQKFQKHLTSPVHHEVRVEVHKTDDKHSHMGDSRQETVSRSRSHEPSQPSHGALLHIEDEKLSSSWPRGHLQSRSHKQKSYASSSSFARSKISCDWSDANNIQHEKEILNKAFQRIHKQNDDPLINSTTRSSSMSHIRKEVKKSRDKVIEIARKHQQARQAVLPSISIISPPAQYTRTSWNVSSGVVPSAPPESERTPSVILGLSPTEAVEESHDMAITTGPTVTYDEDLTPSRPTFGTTGTKSAAKSSLRRRKSEDDTNDQSIVGVEKY